ncbi:MAG: 50S ribosomal protein L32 [Gemmatimonadales bacterium]
MAVPKRKLSKSRKRLRRGGQVRNTTMATQACPRCGSPKLPHRVCADCGYYRGQKRIEVEDN